MIIPVRCFNCNKPISHLWEKYLEMTQSNSDKKSLMNSEKYLTIEKDKDYKTIEAEALEKLGIKKYCCRSTMLSTIDLTEIITKN